MEKLTMMKFPDVVWQLFQSYLGLKRVDTGFLQWCHVKEKYKNL